MEFRKVFDTIPEQFDRYRPRYSAELFEALIALAGISPDSEVLELGPGTGQATKPILDTGCRYTAIELGEQLSGFMRRKFADCGNFSLINDDFITHDFGAARFDLIYSAATIQWIPEEVAFGKSFALIKPGGTLAMMLTHGEYQSDNEALYDDIQKVYEAHFLPPVRYQHGHFAYGNCVNYGFENFETRQFRGRRVFDADSYVAFCGTHCDHIVLEEPHRSAFFEGLREAVLRHGNRIVFNDSYVLMTARKPA